MPVTKIKWPKGGSHVIKSALMIASGRTEAPIIGVSGICHPMPPINGRVPVPGRTIALVPGKPRGVGNLFYRWCILFPKAGPGPKLENGEYELTVTGTNAGGQTETVRRRFRVHLTYAIGIESHFNDDNITDEAADFAPYGELTHPLAEVKLTHMESGTPVPVEHTFSDHEVFYYWTAQFEQLGSGTFTLEAMNAEGHEADPVTGLAVD